MNRMIRSAAKILAGALSVAILMTSCGGKTEGGGEQKNSSQAGAEANAPSQTEPALSDPGEPTEGGEIVLAVTQEPDSLDPYTAKAAGTKEILYNFFEGLMKLTPKSTFEDQLAEKHEMSEDGKQYVFTLRKGVKFHNGKELTATDVVASLKRAAGLNEGDDKPLIKELDVIQGVEGDDEKGTVTIQLEKADPDFLSYMTVPILPADYDQQKEHPIGTGPFRFVEYKTQQHLIMEKNKEYWGEKKAYLDKVTFRIVPSADAAMVDLQAGKIDIFPYLTMDKYELVKDKYDFIDASSNMVQLWALNNQREPFDDPRVRKALDLAIDKKALIDTVTAGFGTVLNSGMAPSMGDFYNAKVNEYGGRDIETAQKLLADAGQGQGLKFTITVPGNYVIHVQTAEFIAAQLADIGVTADIKTVDWGTWLEKVYTGRDYDSTVIALTFDYCAPSTVMARYTSEAGNNFINFTSKEYDEVYAKTEAELDHAKRVDDYHSLQNILFDQNASVFLQCPGVQTAVSKRLGGYTTYPMYVQDMSTVYVKK